MVRYASPSPSLSAPSVRLGSARRMASRPFTRCACEQAATSWSPRLRSPCAKSAPRSRARSRTRATRCGSARCSTAPRSESRLVGRHQSLLDPSLGPSLRRLRRAVVGRPALEDARRRERGDAQGLLGGAALDWRVRDGERLRRARPRPQRDGARVLGRDVLLAPLSDSREESFCCRRDVLLQSGREASERRVGTSFCRRASSATRTFTTTR